MTLFLSINLKHIGVKLSDHYFAIFDLFHTEYYVYLDASPPSIEGNVAVLSSPEFMVNVPSCIQFYYHMLGDGMGTLNVSLIDTETDNTANVWRRSGEVGSTWQSGDLDIYKAGSYRLHFEAVRGSTFESDIAIDDISLLHNSCNGTYCKYCWVLSCIR